MTIAGVGVGEAFGCDYCRSGGEGKHLDGTIAGVGVGEAFGWDSSEILLFPTSNSMTM